MRKKGGRSVLAACGLALVWATALSAQDCADILPFGGTEHDGPTASFSALGPDDARPRLSFWLDGAKLEDFVTRRAASDPDFTEAESPWAGDVTVPVLDRRAVAMGRREVVLLKLGIPVSSDALVMMQQLAASRENDLKGLVLLDASGSAQDFLMPVLQSLQGNKDIAGFHDAPVTALWMFPDGRMGFPRRLTFQDALRSRPDASRELTSFHDGLELDDYAKGLAVLALLGGDVALPDHPALREASDVVVAQITPELDPELAQSTKALEQAVYFDYAPQLGDIVAGHILRSDAFRSDRAERIKLAQQAARYMLCRGAPPLVADGRAGRDWLRNADGPGTIEVWTVLNPLIVTLND